MRLVHEHNISTEINQVNKCKYIKAQISEAFIFPMWSVFPKASKTESGQSNTPALTLMSVQNEAGFQCIVTLLHLHARYNQ